ncbi:hypothetical protein [Helicobacter sp. 16-1353]|uniref:hypothetical protein n=1 Tax=Helicobacter sp. 16-1353 TaxID=2004996 RepID=UPI0015EE4407|nr:hypothetical protein [Helicobacter sp. 16-1353]
MGVNPHILNLMPIIHSPIFIKNLKHHLYYAKIAKILEYCRFNKDFGILLRYLGEF